MNSFTAMFRRKTIGRDDKSGITRQKIRKNQMGFIDSRYYLLYDNIISEKRTADDQVIALRSNFKRRNTLMKKIATARMVMALTLVMVIAAAACGNGGGQSAVVGTWKLKVDAGKAPEEQKAMIQMIESAMNVTFVFTDDGKVKVDANMNFMGQSSSTSTEGTWTQSGNIITVKGASVKGAGLSDDGKMELRDNNKLYIVPPEDASVSNTAEFEYMYFEKQ